VPIALLSTQPIVSLVDALERSVKQRTHWEVDLEGQTVRLRRPRFRTKESRRVWEIREAGGTLSRPRERAFDGRGGVRPFALGKVAES
jgi:hypothetical protein